jgi:hypothetical protein
LAVSKEDWKLHKAANRLGHFKGTSEKASTSRFSQIPGEEVNQWRPCECMSDPQNRSNCAHLSRRDGVCIACGDCLHEIVLNGACYFCGADETEVAAKPQAKSDFVPKDRLRRR